MKHFKTYASIRGLNLSFLLLFCASCASITKPEAVVITANESQKVEFLYWTQWSTKNTVILRALMPPGSECPTLQSGTSQVDLFLRTEPNGEFKKNICETELVRGEAGVWQGVQIKGGAKSKSRGGFKRNESAVIAFEDLKFPRPEFNTLKKVVILGDTGCRIKVKGSQKDIQNCLDPQQWPFAEVAKSAAAEDADFYIHLGDYHYRESPCPEGEKGCAGAAYGDRGDSWDEDFFSPASPLLKGQRWVFVRGNHESCERSHRGWFRYLDSRPYTEDCDDFTKPYLIRLGERYLVVGDAVEERNIQKILDWMAKEPRLRGQKAWLLLHRPFITPIKGLKLPKNMQLEIVMSGHFHELTLNELGVEKPLEWIIGNGGSGLTPPTKSHFNKVQYPGFGYVVLERRIRSGASLNEEFWSVRVKDTRGEATAECELKDSTQSENKLTLDNCMYLK